jgi:hypothetical protein
MTSTAKRPFQFRQEMSGDDRAAAALGASVRSPTVYHGDTREGALKAQVLEELLLSL